MPMDGGMTYNRQLTTSLDAVNRGRDRRMWCVHTVGFHSAPEKSKTLPAGDRRNWRMATSTGTMRKMGMACSLMRELKKMADLEVEQQWSEEVGWEEGEEWVKRLA